MPILEIETQLDGPRLFVPEVFKDDRGFFKETYSFQKYHALGLEDAFVQDSVSVSSRNVIRGMHGDPGMSKLVQVLRGSIWDVIVDARAGSPTYGKWQGFD
jgi:dTDP-4-dehydrorhamnose 3,5-epimerase